MVTHAAGETGPAPPETHAVVLAARDEAHLLHIAEKLTIFYPEFSIIREPDLPWDNQAMAIGIPPTQDRHSLHPVTKNLKLLKECKQCDTM